MKYKFETVSRRKQKEMCLNLNDKDIFWIKDWSQKVLPRKFTEPKQDYFCKKGMSQHVDVIYMKKDKNLHKYVYFTLLQKCDQNLAQTLSVMDKQIKADFPNIKHVFSESDNA